MIPCHPLHCHPRTPCTAIAELTVSLAQQPDGGFHLSFRLVGRPESLRIPEPQPHASFADDLWQHTCFEVFVAGTGSAYREFNFSPSSEWAAYAFTNYRERDSAWQAAAAPSITWQQHTDGFTLTAYIPAALLPAGAQHIGLTTVLESTDGSLSYWALTHPGEQPDFHHRKSFALPIEKPERAETPLLGSASGRS